MLKDIVGVTPLDGYRLHIQFEDGVEGSVDLAEMIEFTGVFEPLKERSFFEKVHVHPEVGAVCWPNGADLDPDVLYHKITGQPIPVVEDHPEDQE